MPESIDKLEKVNLSPLNRLCVWIVLLAGIGLVADMASRLAQGEAFQYLRHTAGIVALLWSIAIFWRTAARAKTLLAQAASELLSKHAPPDWDDARRAAFLARLNTGKLAWRLSLCGMSAMLRGLARQVRDAARE